MSSTVLTVLGTCHHDCPDSCGWVATVEHRPTGPVAVKLRGNPEHPYSKGELCPKVNRFLDRVYANDRVLTPLIRVGPKGEALFRSASWDEATSLVAERVLGVAAERGGDAVATWSSAGTQGLIQMSSLDRRFFEQLGAARQIGSICGATAGAGVATTYGSGHTADPLDVRHSDFVVLWGTNTRLTNRHLWPFVEEARANGAPVVVIDPLRTMTAESADWFLQPLPGTDVALMLAVMHVLVRDGFVDSEYVVAYTTGFDDLAARVSGWTPERAAAVCGLDAAEIERFARMYGSAKRSFIRTLIGTEHHEQGANFFRTLACLPVLTGAWRQRGGGLSRSVGVWADDFADSSVFDPPIADRRPRRALHQNHVGRWLSDPAEGVHALFVWNGNPAVSAPNSDAVRRGLARDDVFTVVSEQFLTDTARYGDVVFPAATQLEQLDVVPAWGHLYLGWNEPAIAPLGEAVPNTELWRRLGAAFGFDDALFALDDEALIRLALQGVDVDRLRADGFVRLGLPEDLRPYASGGFATPDGRAWLRNDVHGASHDALPGYVAPTPDATGRHPLVLLTPKTHTRFLNSSYSSHHGSAESGPVLEIDPSDAAARCIADGDVVRVFNGRGSLSFPARFSGRVRAGVVAVPWGWWGADSVNALTSDTLADWGGGVAFSDTWVEVERIG